MSAPSLSPAAQSNATSERKAARYECFDSLRGIAATVVVSQHCLMTLPMWSDVVLHGVHNRPVAIIFGYPPLNLFWAGNVAVKVFFALSGFVLALMFLHHKRPSYWGFVAKRVCRIYIPYIIVVLLAMGLMAWTAPHETAGLSEWFNASWNGPVTWPLMVDHFLMLGQQRYNFVDNPIWSLVHEMRYSLIFPAIMWLVIKARWPVTVTGSFLVSVAAMSGLRHSETQWLLASLQYAFLFVSGAVIAKHRMDIGSWFQGLTPVARATTVGSSLILLSAYGVGYASIWLIRAFASIAPHIGAVLLLIAILGSKRLQTLLKWRPFLWTGRIAYSLYLSHVVVLLTLVTLLKRVTPVVTILLLTPLVAFALAGLLYFVVERPSISLGRVLAQRIDSKHVTTDALTS